MGNWTLDDIPWDAFDASRVEMEILPLVKAASIVEYNSGDYRTYLTNVFNNDLRVRQAIEGWAKEEVQHGLALGRWAALADPGFDFEASFKRFRDGFRLPLDRDASVRGSRTGELIARCIVEMGTSSYYTALARSADEPVLKAICQKIADDEVAHYWLFYNHMKRYLEEEKLGFWRRLCVAIGRIAESEDDELAYAYYAANSPAQEPYDRRRHSAAYGCRAFAYYSRAEIGGAVTMALAALGLKSDGWFRAAMTAVAWRALRLRQRMQARTDVGVA